MFGSSIALQFILEKRKYLKSSQNKQIIIQNFLTQKRFYTSEYNVMRMACIYLICIYS